MVFIHFDGSMVHSKNVRSGILSVEKMYEMGTTFLDTET